VATTRSRLICVDTVMIDFALLITSLPEAGGDALSSQRLVTTGGGFNVMSAARRQGLDAHYAGQLGSGPFADVAKAELSAQGIRVVVPTREGMDLGVCVVLVDQSGERSFVTSPGAELTLRDEELAGVELSGDEVIYVSGYNVVYPQVAQTLSRWLVDVPAGVTVAFDPGPRCADIDAHVLAQVLERTDWLLCNAAEARLLSREQNAAQCARELRRVFDLDLVVVRDGAAGCVSDDQERTLLAPGYSTEVVDTNGAGDVHNGVVIAELSQGTALEETLLRANAASAIAISSFGPATSPTRDLVDQLMMTQSRSITRVE
jgi:sugar/nucleoside kinase (ribokinase family)